MLIYEDECKKTYTYIWNMDIITHYMSLESHHKAEYCVMLTKLCVCQL